MRRGSAVGIHDDFPSGQAGISGRSADHEAAGGIDQDPGFVRQQFLGNNGQNHLLLDCLPQLIHIHVSGMLGGNHHGIHRHGLIVFVFHCHLGLSVRIEERQRAVLAHLRQAKRHPVAQGNGQGHSFGRLGAGVAEHHALVAGTDIRFLAAVPGFQGVIHAHGDIRALLVNGGHHGAGIAVEGFFR